VIPWFAAGLLVYRVIPDVLADTSPGAAPDSAAGAVRLGAAITAGIGVVILGSGLSALVQRWNTAARVGLVLAGIGAAIQGLMLLSGGTAFLAHGPAMRAAANGMLIAAAADLGVALLVCALSFSHLLPGQSLAERMRLPAGASAALPGRRLMLLLTVAIVAGWLTVTAMFLAIASPGMDFTPAVGVLLVCQLVVMPVLAGALAAGWREGAIDRLRTIGLAAAAGILANWLFCVAAWLWEIVRFPGQDFASGEVDLDVPILCGIVGAVLGVAGYGLWSALLRRHSRFNISRFPRNSAEDCRPAERRLSERPTTGRGEGLKLTAISDSDAARKEPGLPPQRRSRRSRR
jgi:hypothetical protein